jgi:DNA polymerase bacteriophage-type
MPILHRDIETFSTLNLSKVGPWRYAGDPATGVWCVACAIDDGPVQIWTPGQPVPEEFHVAARDPTWLIAAHNDAFESAIEARVLAPRFGWPLVPIERHRCTMAAALASALPGGLDKAAAALGLELRKDDAGRRLMLQMAKPRAARAGEDPNGIYWHDDPERIRRLQEYCAHDVEVERALFKRLPPLSDSEQALWALDAEINRRGFPVDVALAEAAHTIARERRIAIDREISELTDGRITTANQVTKIEAFLKERGHNVQSVGKRSVAAVLAHKPDHDVAQLLRLRQEAAKASANKLAALLNLANDDRLHDTLRFHGAATGRWSGSRFQPQNLARATPTDLEAAIAAVKSGDIARATKLGPPLAVIGSLSRAMICAPPGRVLVGADYSGIEARVTAWLAGGSLMASAATMRPAIPSSIRTAASKILGRLVTPEQDADRQIGKMCTLAFGFGGGAGAFRRLAPDADFTDAQVENFKRQWRAAHPRIVRLWGELHRMLLRAVCTGKPVALRNLSAEMRSGNLYLRLPSGRELAYPEVRLQPGKFDSDEIVFKDSAIGKWQDVRAWHGTFTENVVQAIARDLLAGAMPRLEAAGYPIVLHVHDEIVAEVPEAFGSLEEFAALMTELPVWAEGLPTVAKAWRQRRYGKEGKPTDPTDPVDPIDEGKPTDPTDPTDPIDEIDSTDPIDEIAEDKSMEEEPQPVTPENIAAINAGLQREGIEPITAASPAVAATIADMLASTPRGTTTGSPSSADVGSDTEHSDDKNEYPHGENRTGRHSTTYLYRDHLGGNHTKVEKWRSSTAARATYPQSFWVQGRWVSQKPQGWTRIPYRLPEMLAALTKDSTADLFVPEGEKDADTLAALGLIATTSSEGATPLKAKVGKWAPELSRWFHGARRLFILADNDEVGRRFAEEKARALGGIVPDTRVVLFPDVPEGEDVSYWLNAKHTKEELLARCEAAPRWNDAELESVRADQVPLRAICCLWDKRFAVGKIGIIAGLPDEGKGQILCYIAARATRGLKWPNNEGTSPRGNVLILSAEEDPGDSLAPRLAAAGADLSCIHFVNMVCDRDEKTGQPRKRMFSLVSDLEKLRQKITEVGDVRVILIDPISAYLGVGKVDSYRDTDVRAVLGPLKELAEETRAAVITVMHFNKKIDITNALLRVSNSMAFVGLPRHAYGVIADPENARKLFVRAKNNDAAEADNKTLAFHFDVKEVGADPDSGEPIRAPYIIWEPGYVDITATEAMQAASDNKSPGERDKAKNLLLALLAGDREVFATDIKGEAEANGLSWRTMNRAKDELNEQGHNIIVNKDRNVPNGKWFWKLEV